MARLISAFSVRRNSFLFFACSGRSSSCHRLHRVQGPDKTQDSRRVLEGEPAAPSPRPGPDAPGAAFELALVILQPGVTVKLTAHTVSVRVWGPAGAWSSHAHPAPAPVLLRDLRNPGVHGAAPRECSRPSGRNVPVASSLLRALQGHLFHVGCASRCTVPKKRPPKATHKWPQ